MGLLDRIAERRRGGQRSYPVPGDLDPWATERGHDDHRFSPPEYGNYLATSADVFSCASLRARHAGSLPVRLFRGSDVDRVEMPGHRAAKMLNGKVNPFWTASRLFRMDELSMCLWGESVWAIQRDGRGEPNEVWWLNPSRVHPVPDRDDYLRGFLYRPATGGVDIAFRTDEIVWFRYPNPVEELSPTSPLAAARLAAETSSEMMKANRQLFRRGLLAGGMVVPTNDKVMFSENQARELEGLIHRRFTGAENSHRWQVLRYQARFDGLDVSPKDAQWIEGMNLSFLQVCRAYGVPPPLVADLQHATLANTREYDTILWTHALVPDFHLRAQEIVCQFLALWPQRTRPDHMEFDYSKVAALQAAQSGIWDRERQQIDAGGLTVNEWRRKYGLAPVAWGDVWWAPVNKSPVSSADGFDNGDDADSNAAQVLDDLASTIEDYLAGAETPSPNGSEPAGVTP